MLRTTYRLGFIPSLAYNIILNKAKVRPWFNRVDDTVIIGALPWLTICDRLINDEMVGGVVSMNENFELRLLNKWVADKQYWESQNVKFLQLATQDIFEAPNQKKLHLGVEFIMPFTQKSSNDRKRSVYVHCKAGRTRSATLVACYLMARNHWNPEQAIQYLGSRRPQLAMHRPQMDALQQFFDNFNLKVMNNNPT